MTPEIKQRIEQIRNGEVPEGYKKTKYGIFPSHWKVDKLGNYLQELRELSNEIEKYPIYSSSRKGLLPQSQYYDKREAVTTNLGYKKVPNGYVTYRHMSDDDIFRFNKNTTDDTVLVSSEYPVFNCNTNGDIDYILPLLNDSPRFKYYCRIQKMGGTRTRLYYKNLCQYTTAFPPLKEQQKIANILSAQDKVIECYEKKIEQLKRMKKYYLQNMFPKHGETVPKIRFKGFTEPWEKRKLGDYVIIISGDAPSKFDNGDELYVKVDDLNYSPKYIADSQSKVATNKFIKKAPKGSVIFPKRGTAIMTNKVRILSENSYMDTNMMALSSEKIESEFLYNVITKEGLYRIADTSTIPQINNKHIEPYEVLLPEFGEQIIIGKLFKDVDSLITLHQRKLEEEKKKKKALQQLLLTGIVRA